MEQNETSKMIGLVACLTIITVMVALIGWYLPVLMIATIWISTLPIVFIVVKWNEKVALIVIAIGYFLFAIITQNLVNAAVISFTFAFAGLSMGYSIKRKWEFRPLFSAVTVGYLLSILGSVVLVNTISGVNQIEKHIIEPMTIFLNNIQTTLQENIAQIAEHPIYGLLFNQIEREFDVQTYIYLLSAMIPAFFIIICMMFAYFTITASKMMLKRIGLPYSYLPSFHQLQANRGTAWVYLLGYILLLFFENSTMRAAFVNILLIISVLLAMCGLSVADYFVKRAGIYRFLRVIIYVIVFFASTLVATILPLLHPFNLLLIVGILDSMFDFRKLWRTKKGEYHG